MPFQTVVNRNFTAGFVGDIAADGPLRAKVGRIKASTFAGATREKGAVVGRAFGYVGTVPATGTTQAANVPVVEVGGKNFAGVLFHPKHYVLQGTQAGGALAPSLEVPAGTEGEFADMVIMFASLINYTTASQTVLAGAQIAYVPSDITAENDALLLPIGALITVPEGVAIPAGYVLIKNAKVMNPVTIGASAAGALVAATTSIQLT